MRHLLIALLVLVSVACESNKESLPGSYKIERSKAELEESEKTYSLKNFSPSQDRTSFTYSTANNRAWDQDLYKGTFSLKPSVKNQKNYITLNLTIDDAEISRIQPFSKDPEKIQDLEIIYKDLKVTCLFVCRDSECKTIAISPNFSRVGKVSYYLFSTVWHMTLPEGENNSDYKVTEYFYIQGSQEIYTKLFSDPNYILKIPVDSPELKKWPL